LASKWEAASSHVIKLLHVTYTQLLCSQRPSRATGNWPISGLLVITQYL